MITVLDPTHQTEAETPVTVGRVVSSHGVFGELKVESLTDFPERFDTGSRLWLHGTPYRVARARIRGRSVILKLDGINTREAAQALRNAELTVPEPAKLEEPGVYYVHDLIGLTVDDTANQTLGRLDEVIETGSNDVYVLHGERGELLLPALDDVILNVDIAAGRMTVDVPPGIEFQARPSKPAKRRRPPQSPDGSGYARNDDTNASPDGEETSSQGA